MKGKVELKRQLISVVLNLMLDAENGERRNYPNIAYSLKSYFSPILASCVNLSSLVFHFQLSSKYYFKKK